MSFVVWLLTFWGVMLPCIFIFLCWHLLFWSQVNGWRF
jgi:hypothetical protein